MSSLVKLTIQWKEEITEINIDEGDTLADLKRKIHSVTHLEPARQEFFDFPLLESIEDDVKIKDLNLQPNYVFIVTDKLSSDKTADEPQPSTSKQSEEIKTIIFKVMHEPRDNKKLVVLDLDHTIYDSKALDAAHLARPFLQEFLQGVYEEYDIAVWSATELNFIEKKLAALNMIENPNYKIVFALGLNAMAKVSVQSGRYFLTKPLEVIWGKYDQYNSTNTIICDDRFRNFSGNPRNGVHVKRYDYEEHNDDKELLHLMTYLKLIVKQKDFTAVDHKIWREYKDYNTDSATDSDNYNYGGNSSGGTE